MMSVQMRQELVGRVVAGERRAVARALRIVDDAPSAGRALAADLFPYRRGAWVVGVTGNPGAGKSTLVDALVAALRTQQKRVAVLAVDPSSPFSGGAILGDRIRMSRHAADDGVFIRSLATRGALGGLSRAAFDSVRVLDTAGFDVVLVETVGVGQDEIDVARLAHTTLVVLVPGLGDDIQAIKAGILEIADLFVINKADRDGVDEVERSLKQMLSLNTAHVSWEPSIKRTVASRGEGIVELLAAMADHHAFIHSESGVARRSAQAAEIFERLLDVALVDAGRARLKERVAAANARARQFEADPYSLVRELVDIEPGMVP